MADVIYHLAFQSDWEAAQSAGEYRSPSLSEEGFIHASADEEQMMRVVSRLFAGRTDLLVLDVDTDQLAKGSDLIREPSRSGEIYPHVYGPINLDAVVRVRALIVDASGSATYSPA